MKFKLIVLIDFNFDVRQVTALMIEERYRVSIGIVTSGH